MRQYLPYEGETLYIAGPCCFYYDGYAVWHAYRGLAEFKGFRVLMPTSNKLDLTHEDLRLNGDTIFNNCARAMNECTAIIADLESFRGTEPDGGTLFELGMGYARGLRLYAYTRDKRPLIHKYGTAVLRDGQVVDGAGQPFPYPELPFCPSLMGSTKIIEGTFQDALNLLEADVDLDRRRQAWPTETAPAAAPEPGKRGGVFLFTPRVYEEGVRAWLEEARSAFAAQGLCLTTPLDALPGEPQPSDSDPRTKAMHLFERWQRQTRACDVFLADLRDWNGLEPSGDVGFLAGMAWQLGKKCLGYMPDTRCMRQRIPHYGPELDNKDQFGNDVENFNYPINIMFSSSMPIEQADSPTELIGRVKAMM